MFHAENPQILGATLQNSFAQSTWYLGFMYPWTRICWSHCREPYRNSVSI